MIKYIFILLTLLFFSFSGKASHVMGGDITWTCQGGNYVFQLVFYRDCNGAIINTGAETIDVWGHPSLSSITLNYVSSSDVSPTCTQVAGSPVPLDCGSGTGGGNGLGAIEKAIYRSNPINLTGTPPASGWIFTFQNFSRSGSITNLVDPSNAGITITAKMFAIPGGVAGTCVDNSPQFLQEPYFVSCVGEAYEYNMNAVDVDLDSLHIQFGQALNHFPSAAYNPPTTPAPVAYESGFSFLSPTPGTGMNAGNITAQVDPSSGNLTFLSNNSGNFVIKIVAQSFRNGALIAEVEREIQLIVTNCAGTNNKPVINGPFAGLFETTINAGDLVNFNLNSTDIEVLQDGSPQDNILSATGLLFGTNYTSNAGCAIAPCATLNTTPLITMSQGVNTTFNWQTSCDHLVNPTGQAATSIPYHFVFKVQDNYCQVPKVSYATVTINILNPGVVLAPAISCIQSDATGDVTINWNQVVDPAGTFNEYQIYSLQNGLLGTVGNIATTSFTQTGVIQENDYYVASASGCNGNALNYSDTISNIFLTLNNPNNGTALLSWNDPVNPALPSMNAYYHIYREYPVGTWSLYDSVPYGTHFYRDTIQICSTLLSYQVVLPNQPCDYTSNIEADTFEDKISPDIPVIYSVTIDSLTNDVTITWNQNAQEDTYGYIIYVRNAAGSIVELDQVFGITTTSYTYSPDVTIGPLTYSVAAFDSCFTASIPPVNQTSAKAEVHTTSFLSRSLDICNRTVRLNWTGYVGWAAIDRYEIYSKNDLGVWVLEGTTSGTTFTIDVMDALNYDFVIQAFSSTGAISFSNRVSIFISAPNQPAFNYVRVATVNDKEIHLRLHIDVTVNIPAVSIQKKINGIFQEIDQLPISAMPITYIDTDVDVNESSYVYRTQILDSCGRLGITSNEAATILLTIENDEVEKINYLNWTPYYDFDGSLLSYNVYRGVSGIFEINPIATLPNGHYSYEDDVSELYSTGRVCYQIQAIEGMNVYSFSESSYSNVLCSTVPPLIYIPNAFTPGGLNPIFKPVISDFDGAGYDFSIFDQWGQVIFKTANPDDGWDGSIKLSGKLANTGTYVYFVKLHDGDGIEIIKRGHVTLLK
jgi:hypothetical protein